jgi:hypothetical protein
MSRPTVLAPVSSSDAPLPDGGQESPSVPPFGDSPENSLSRSSAAKIDVRCPDESMIAKPGLAVVWDATSDGKLQTATLAGTHAERRSALAMD